MTKERPHFSYHDRCYRVIKIDFQGNANGYGRLPTKNTQPTTATNAKLIASRTLTKPYTTATERGGQILGNKPLEEHSPVQVGWRKKAKPFPGAFPGG